MYDGYAINWELLPTESLNPGPELLQAGMAVETLLPNSLMTIVDCSQPGHNRFARGLLTLSFLSVK